MAVNITNRADAEALIREQIVYYFSGCTEAVCIYGDGAKATEYDQQSDQDSSVGFPSNCVLGRR